MSSQNRLLAEQSRLVGRVRGRVVEIGAGTGANFQWLRPDVEWVGVEPDPVRAEALQKRARSHGHRAPVLCCTAEALPLSNASVDVVLCTRALCSVRDLEQVLQEIRRVLRPKGTLVALEHVAAPRGTITRAFQRMAAPVTRRFDHGCDPVRETVEVIEKSGMHCLSIEEFRVLGIPVVSGLWANQATSPGGT